MHVYHWTDGNVGLHPMVQCLIPKQISDNKIEGGKRGPQIINNSSFSHHSPHFQPMEVEVIQRLVGFTSVAAELKTIESHSTVIGGSNNL